MTNLLAQDESEWLDRAREGDSDAFSNIVAHYLPKVFSLCVRLTGNREDAEDCSQETFVKAWIALGEFRERSSIYTWLYRIAANTCHDLLRKKARQQSVSLDESYDDSNTQIILLQDEDPLPDDQIIIKEAAIEIRKLMLELPDNLREVLILRDIQQLSYKEIALLQNTAEGTIKSRIFRARQQMTELLKNLELY